MYYLIFNETSAMSLHHLIAIYNEYVLDQQCAIAPGIAPTPPNHAPIVVSTFAPNVEPDTPDTNTLVKLSSFHV